MSRSRAYSIARSIPSMLANGLPGAPQIPSNSSSCSAPPVAIATVETQRGSTCSPSFAAA